MDINPCTYKTELLPPRPDVTGVLPTERAC
jgi:hypothetical protein